MANNGVSIKMTAAGGKPLAELERLIRMRAELIKGETTDSAVASTAINMLKSIRAATKVAKPEKDNFGFTVAERPDLVAGFKGRGQWAHRVVRQAGGHELENVKTVNLAGNYKRGEVTKVYIALMKYSKFDKNLKQSSKTDRLYIISPSEELARAYMRARMKKRIEKYAGMARWTVGQAMKQVAIKMGARASADAGFVRSAARKVGLRNLVVNTQRGGNASRGTASVSVRDLLDYSVAALEGGEAALQTAAMKAANKTASVINHWLNHMGRTFDGGTVEAPFPEIVKRRK